MRDSPQSRLGAATCSICALSLTISGLPGQSSSAPIREQVSSDQKRAVVLRDLTLPEAARRLGGTVTVTGQVGPFEPAHSLKTLGDRSDLVFVGTAVRASSALTVDERSIVTFYEVQVERVYKGDGFRESTRLHLAFPGGRVEFGNGLAAEVKTVGLEPLALGQRYALFTKRLASDDRLLLSTSEQLVFRLALGSESIFHLLESGVIGPRTLETDLTVTYEGVSVHSFLQTLDKLWSGR